MPATRMTTVHQRQEMARLAAAGQPYQVIADQTGVSFWTVRKWVRQANQGGLPALLTHFGRPAIGPMAGFDPLIRYVVDDEFGALSHKDKSFADWVIFWKRGQPATSPGADANTSTPVDAATEAQRITSLTGGKTVILPNAKVAGS